LRQKISSFAEWERSPISDGGFMSNQKYQKISGSVLILRMHGIVFMAEEPLETST